MGMPAGTASKALCRYDADCRLPILEFHQIAFIRSQKIHGCFGMADRTDAIRPVQGMAFLQEPLEIGKSDLIQLAKDGKWSYHSSVS